MAPAAPVVIQAWPQEGIPEVAALCVWGPPEVTFRMPHACPGAGSRDSSSCHLRAHPTLLCLPDQLTGGSMHSAMWRDLLLSTGYLGVWGGPAREAAALSLSSHLAAGVECACDGQTCGEADQRKVMVR